MKNYLILTILTISISLEACQSKTKKTAKASTECESGCKQCPSKCDDTNVTKSTVTAGLYYFHGDRKCKTCKVVGSKAKEIAEKLNVKFFDVNIDKDENKTLATEFQATSSSLFVKHVKSGEIENLTNFAFLNAINNPQAYIEKLEATLKSEN